MPAMLSSMISHDEVWRHATEWSATGKDWHFHILRQHCSFNSHGGETLLLENSTDGRVYVSVPDQTKKLHKELLQLLHGKKILDASMTSDPAVLQHVHDLVRNGEKWHHHMLFPHCTLNSHKGKWNIVIEGDGMSEFLYDSEPVDDLRQIELLVYK
jgi:hypothetical protein